MRRTAENGAYDPDGVLRKASALQFPGGLHFDPILTQTNTDEQWLSLIYGTLLRPNVDGRYDPWLAESVEVVDPLTLSVTIREGITFTDGAPYDAEAVRTGMLRTLRQAATPGVIAGQHRLFKELSDIVVESPLVARFVLRSPVAGEFVSVFAGRESAVPSPQAIADGVDLDKTPIGAGPFVLAEYRESELVSLRKNAGFIDADKWRLGGVDFIGATAGEATVTALLADQVDEAVVTPTDLPAIEAKAGIEIVRTFQEFAYYTLNFCSTKAPWDNELLRKAVQRGIDREAFNRLVYQGEGEPAYGYWRQDGPNFADELVDMTGYDPNEARRLVTEAAVSNVVLELYVLNSAADQRMGEVIQSQLAEVGITVDLVPINGADVVTNFVTPQRTGAIILPGTRAGTERVLQQFQGGSLQNYCDADRSNISSLALEIAGVDLNDPKAAELWQQIDLENAEHAYVVFLARQPSLTALNTDRVGGELRVSSTRSSSTYQDLQDVYIRA